MIYRFTTQNWLLS